MVDVAHYGDHRGAKLQILLLVFRVEDDFFLRGRLDEAGTAFAAFETKTESVLGADVPGNRLLDRLVDIRENVERHQVGDELEWLALHRLCEVADNDRRLERDQRAIGWSRVLWLARATAYCGRFGRCATFLRFLFLLVLPLVLFLFTFADGGANRHVAQFDKSNFLSEIAVLLLFLSGLGGLRRRRQVLPVQRLPWLPLRWPVQFPRSKSPRKNPLLPRPPVVQPLQPVR